MFLTFQWFVFRRQCKGRRRMETNNGKWDRQMLLQSGPDANLPDCQNWNKWGGTESDTAQAKYRHRVRHRRTWLGSTISYVALTQRHKKSKLSDWQNFMNKTIWKVLRLSGNFASTAIYLFTLKMIRLPFLGNFVNTCKTFWSGNIFPCPLVVGKLKPHIFNTFVPLFLKGNTLPQQAWKMLTFILFPLHCLIFFWDFQSRTVAVKLAATLSAGTKRTTWTFARQPLQNIWI